MTIMTVILQQLGVEMVSIALLYLLPVLVNAAIWGLSAAIYAACLGVLAFNFFFVPPLASFSVSDAHYLVTFGVYFAVAALTAGLAAKLNKQIRISAQREAHTAALYTLSKQLGTTNDTSSLLAQFAEHVHSSLEIDTVVYLAESSSSLVLVYPLAPSADNGSISAEAALAKNVFVTGEASAVSPRDSDTSLGYMLPLQTEGGPFGVLALYMSQEAAVGSSNEYFHLFEGLGGLISSAIARIKLAEEARLAHITAESERLRTAILNSVSHELRTPLAAIIGSATGLIENERLFSQEDRAELLMTIRDGALRMNRLVLNLLGMARLEGGMLRLRENWCDIEDIIGVMLSQVKGDQEHRELVVKLPEGDPILVLGDEVLLEQMLVNVISNAIKYSPDYSKIIVSVRLEAEQVIIMVSDHGIGIQQEEYERIFDKFYRSERAMPITGTGLGLAISKGIAELHEGTIVAGPHEPQGTTITITLPERPTMQLRTDSRKEPEEE
ncbi:ATP-binding protein [Paenibacillus massiliensis]|uniref:ATP-binding protein n=1 Tax=Paenibacillus massiliensis TaxID=225917 RepID=UPI0006844F66|nr:ATP-binding protein [Paenibacillus massiliensis]